MLQRLYDLKLKNYKEKNIKESPDKLLAMLLLQEKDKYKPITGESGKFYEYYKEQIDEKISQVEKDFEFTKDEIIELIEEKGVFCDDYGYDKIWFVFCEGFGVLQWGLMYNNDKTPEELYIMGFSDRDFIWMCIQDSFKLESIVPPKIKDVIFNLSEFYELISLIVSKEQYIYVPNLYKYNCNTECCGKVDDDYTLRCGSSFNEKSIDNLKSLKAKSPELFYGIIVDILTSEEYSEIIELLEIKHNCNTECTDVLSNDKMKKLVFKDKMFNV